jgi:hypothetical protein
MDHDIPLFFEISAKNNINIQEMFNAAIEVSEKVNKYCI